MLWKIQVCTGVQLFQVDGVTHWMDLEIVCMLLIGAQNCQIGNADWERHTFVPTFVPTFQILYLPIDE